MLIMLIMLIMLLLFSCMLTIIPRITGEYKVPSIFLPFLGIYESITAHVLSLAIYAATLASVTSRRRAPRSLSTYEKYSNTTPISTQKSPSAGENIVS